MGSLKKFPHCTPGNQPPTGQNKLLFHEQVHLPSTLQQDKGENTLFPGLKAKLQALLAGIITHFLAVFWVSDLH